MIKPTNIALFAMIALIGLGLSQHALADNQVYSIKNMWNVKVAHVGDTIVVVNDDKMNHSITGKDSTGNRVDMGLAPGQQTDLQFMFPGEFAFYDKYAVNQTGVIYIYDPNVDLASIHVYNKTSTNDLFEKPQYAASYYTPISGNATAPTNQTISFGFSNGTNTTPVNNDNTNVSTPVTTPVPVQDNSTMGELKAVIALQQSQIQNLKSQLSNETKQTSYWQTQAQQWETVAERLAQIVQSLP